MSYAFLLKYRVPVGVQISVEVAIYLEIFIISDDEPVSLGEDVSLKFYNSCVRYLFMTFC